MTKRRSRNPLEDLKRKRKQRVHANQTEKARYLCKWEEDVEPDKSDELGLLRRIAICMDNAAEPPSSHPIVLIEVTEICLPMEAEIMWMCRQLQISAAGVMLGPWSGYKARWIRPDGKEVNGRFYLNHTGNRPLLITREPKPETLQPAEAKLVEFIVNSAANKLKEKWNKHMRKRREAGPLIIDFEQPDKPAVEAEQEGEGD